MKGAVLCNGPSRIAYQPSDEYQFVLGCNIPWTECDATVIVDDVVIIEWNKNHSLINTDVYFSKEAWRKACELDQVFFSQYFAGEITHGKHYDSSGHTAVRTMIDLGYTEIDIYGCDAYFKRNVESYTSNFIIRDTSPNAELRKVQRAVGWKVQWDVLIGNNPNVKLNFIRHK